VGRVAQSVQRLATGRTVRELNPGGGEIIRTCPDWPWSPPSLLYNKYRLFPGGIERPGPDAGPSPLSSDTDTDSVMSRCAIGSAVTDVSKASSYFIFRGKLPTVHCNVPEVFKQHRCENLNSRKRFLRHGI
jgi:hypothetical protein